MFESPSRPRSAGEVAPEPFVVGLAIGDAFVVTAFVCFGLFTHAIEPWTVPVYALRTSAPFVISWAAIAPLSGAYRGRVLGSVRWTLAVGSATWIATSLLGGLIRATSLFPGGAPPEFLLVNAVLGLGFVLPWRVAVTVGLRGRSSRR